MSLLCGPGLTGGEAITQGASLITAWKLGSQRSRRHSAERAFQKPGESNYHNEHEVWSQRDWSHRELLGWLIEGSVLGTKKMGS